MKSEVEVCGGTELARVMQIVRGPYFMDRRFERLVNAVFWPATRNFTVGARRADDLLMEYAVATYQQVYGQATQDGQRALEQLPLADRNAALMAEGVFQHAGHIYCATGSGVIAVSRSLLECHSARLIFNRVTETVLRYLHWTAVYHLRSGGSLNSPLQVDLETLRTFCDPCRSCRNSHGDIVRALHFLQHITVDLRTDELMRAGSFIVRNLEVGGKRATMILSPEFLGCIPGLIVSRNLQSKGRRVGLSHVSYFRDNPARILLHNAPPRILSRQRRLISIVLMGIRRRDSVDGNRANIFIGSFGNLLNALGYRGSRADQHGQLLIDLSEIAVVTGAEISPDLGQLSIPDRELQPICVSVNRNFFENDVARYIEEAAGLKLQFLSKSDSGFCRYLGHPGHHLKLRRIAAGLSQRELANLASVSRRTLGRWELDQFQPSNPIIRRVLSVLRSRSETHGSLPRPKSATEITAATINNTVSGCK